MLWLEDSGGGQAKKERNVKKRKEEKKEMSWREEALTNCSNKIDNKKQ